MAVHFSILTWRIPWTEDPGRLQSMGSQKVRLSLSNFHFPLGLTGLISFLLFRGLSSLLQHHNSKTLILQHSAFFMVQLSHQFSLKKTIALTILTFVGKVMSLAVHLLYCICFPIDEPVGFQCLAILSKAAVTLSRGFGGRVSLS